MENRHRDWQGMLVRLQVVLVALLIVIAAFVILYLVASVLARFYGTIFLFVVGAIVAYLLIPVVNLAQRLVRKRWAAIVTVYLGVFLAMALLGLLLLNPFVQQAQSLARNLQHPSAASLKGVSAVKAAAAHVQDEIEAQATGLAAGRQPSATAIDRTSANIAELRKRIGRLGNAPGLVAQPLASGVPPPRQTQVPRSYVTPVAAAADKLSGDYARATQTTAAVTSKDLNAVRTDVRSTTAAASVLYTTMSTTPLLLLDLQDWLDAHGFKIDIHERFGKAADQVNSQAASLVNNAASIVLTAGTLMVNALLMLIISVYLLSDGPRLVRKLTQIGPTGYRARAPFYVASLDKVMGSYIRGQILIAAIAAVLGAGGAWLLGVPYAVLIGISTFFLILIPVIGAVILVIPPVLIALVFTPLTTAVFLLIYYLVMMQIVTNVIGPRVVGSAVGIHPLEAMAAALVGYPIAGLIGSFFAVPILGFIHIAVRQAYRDFGRREMEELQAVFEGEPEPVQPKPVT